MVRSISQNAGNDIRAALRDPSIASQLDRTGVTPDVELSGDNNDSATNLQACIGECDTDSQCAAGLECYQRDDYAAIPGCKGTGKSNWYVSAGYVY
jgi:hypothetical protein